MSIVAMTLDCNPASAVSAQPQETSDGSTCHPPCRFGGDIDRDRPAPMLAAMMVRWRIAVQGRNTSARSVEDRNLRVGIGNRSFLVGSGVPRPHGSPPSL